MSLALPFAASQIPIDMKMMHTPERDEAHSTLLDDQFNLEVAFFLRLASGGATGK